MKCDQRWQGKKQSFRNLFRKFYRTQKKLQSIFLLQQLRRLPLKPLILRQKGTQRTCLRLPSLTYWVFTPTHRVCTGVRELGGTLTSKLNLLVSIGSHFLYVWGSTWRADTLLEYISSTLALFSLFALILAQKGRCSRMLQLIRAWAQLTNTIFLDFFDRPLNLWMLPKLVWRN